MAFKIKGDLTPKGVLCELNKLMRTRWTTDAFNDTREITRKTKEGPKVVEQPVFCLVGGLRYSILKQLGGAPFVDDLLKESSLALDARTDQILDRIADAVRGHLRYNSSPNLRRINKFINSLSEEDWEKLRALLEEVEAQALRLLAVECLVAEQMTTREEANRRMFARYASSGESTITSFNDDIDPDYSEKPPSTQERMRRAKRRQVIEVADKACDAASAK